MKHIVIPPLVRGSQCVEVKNEVQAAKTDDSIPCCCRICLNTDSKLKPMKLYGLRGAYELMTGIPLNHDDGLPQVLCVECATHLLKFHKFRDKCLEANDVLHDINLNTRHTTRGYVKVKMIKKARANIEKLHSSLICCYSVVDLDIPPKPYDVATSFMNEDDSDSDIVMIDDIDKTLEKTSNSLTYDEEWLELDMTEETNGPSQDNSGDNDDVFRDSEETIDEPTTKTKTGNVTKSSTSKYKIKAKRRRSYVTTTKNLKIIAKRQKDDENESKDDYTDEFVKKLMEFVAKDDLDENDYIELQRRRYNKVGDQTVKCIKMKKKRDAFLDECFVKKTLLSLEEQISSYEKLKHCQSYVNANFKCEMCYRGFLIEQFLKTHNDKYHSTSKGKYFCKVCKMRCRSVFGLLKHIHRHHVYEYKCKTCDETFCYDLSAEIHAKNHKGIKKVCGLCGQEFELYTLYYTHIRKKHPSSDHVCLICGFSFVSEQGLNGHTKRAHKENTDFADAPCVICDLKFASEKALETHMGIKHSDGKPLCNDMSTIMRSTNKSRIYLNKSRIYLKKKHYPRKPVVQFPVPCEMCGVEINSFKEYRSHFFKEHPGVERTFKQSQFYSHMCDQCGKKFHSESVLKDHLLTHESEISFKCPKCDKTFKSIYEKRAHVYYSHHEPIKCHICGKRITRNNLHRHIITKHTEGVGKTVVCEICGKSFKANRLLAQHTKHVHMNVPWPRKTKSADGPPVIKRRRFQQDTPEGDSTEMTNMSLEIMTYD